MKTVHIFYLSLVVTALILGCNEPRKQGSIVDDSFRSQFLDTRSVTIYLPPSYTETSNSYPVLYLHDGQMLFDSTTTWNGQEWGVDETLDKLISQDKIHEVIVVGIWNGDMQRHAEYFPQRPFESLSPHIQDSLYSLKSSEEQTLFASRVKSDDYLKFLVLELKPYIDHKYRTISGPTSTFIGGSSMGGLISMYALCEYPNVFGGAICMSTHWPGVFTVENNPIPDAFFAYMKGKLPSPVTHKFYFDYGTETLDALYEPFQKQADSAFWEKGYDSGNFLTKKFPGDAHDERSWNKRLHEPLTFLFKK